MRRSRRCLSCSQYEGRSSRSLDLDGVVGGAADGVHIARSPPPDSAAGMRATWTAAGGLSTQSSSSSFDEIEIDSVLVGRRTEGEGERSLVERDGLGGGCCGVRTGLSLASSTAGGLGGSKKRLRIRRS